MTQTTKGCFEQGDSKIYYEITGQGATVVLSHAGFLDSLSNFWGETGQINRLDHWLLDDVRLVELAPAWRPLMED